MQKTLSEELNDKGLSSLCIATYTTSSEKLSAQRVFTIFTLEALRKIKKKYI